jgi:hypothetical protein
MIARIVSVGMKTVSRMDTNGQNINSLSPSSSVKLT